MYRPSYCGSFSAWILLGLLSAPGGITLAADPLPAWFDFTGWDHATVVSSGQYFSDVGDGLGVLVTASPNHSVLSASDGVNISTGVNTHDVSFTFVFDEPRNLVIDVQSLDRFETLTITSEALASYTHREGALPTLAGNLTLSGNGVAFGPDGAARGLITLPASAQFTWTYGADRDLKFERFRVGQVVPEPASLTLVLLGVLALGARRKQGAAQR